VLVENGEGEVGPVAVGGEGRLGQGGQVVHVVEAGPVRVVVARQQQVDVVGSLGEGERGGGVVNLCFRLLLWYFCSSTMLRKCYFLYSCCS